MTTPNYEYFGLMVKYWDLLRGDTSNWDDRFFFLDVIKKYGSPHWTSAVRRDDY